MRRLSLVEMMGIEPMSGLQLLASTWSTFQILTNDSADSSNTQGLIDPEMYC